MKMHLNIPKKTQTLNRSTMIERHYYLVEIIGSPCDYPTGTKFVAYLCKDKIILFRNEDITIFYESNAFDPSFDGMYKILKDVTDRIYRTVDVER